MTLEILAAVTLSISSTNEYFFTRPVSTNLVGKTYVLDGKPVPRYEDIAFLNEAYAERNMAIGGEFTEFTVPNGLAISAGSFGTSILPWEWFAPSFGMWGGGDAWTRGFFLRSGISVRPLYRETGSSYRWDGHDTSFTNTIRAFVDPSSAAFPTNDLFETSLSGHPRIELMKNAYRIIKDYVNPDVRILTRGDVWSVADKMIYRAESTSRSVTQYGYSTYKYRTESGEHTSSYATSIEQMTRQSPRVSHVTNSAPISLDSVWRIPMASRTVTMKREFGVRRNDYDAAHKYTLNRLQPDYESYNYYTSDHQAVGNVLATSPLLDVMLTNTLDEVKCICVIRFRVNQIDYYQGQSSLTNRYENNRYFVVAWDGFSAKSSKYPKYGENTIWDTGVPIMDLAYQVYVGSGFMSWGWDVSAPSVDYDNTESDSIVGSSTASHIRQVFIYVDDIYPYFYIKRKWNARVLNQ